MMFPPVFATINVPAVQALLKTGAGPLRFYLFGKADQNTPKPYAVWQTAFGSPENTISDRPDTDGWTLQVDVYASPTQGADVARAVAEVLRDAIEPVAYITSWIGDSVDPITSNFRFTFQCDWLTPR